MSCLLDITCNWAMSCKHDNKTWRADMRYSGRNFYLLTGFGVALVWPRACYAVLLAIRAYGRPLALAG